MKRSHHVIGPFIVTEHTWDIPIDHHDPAQTISIFAREVARSDAKDDRIEARPWLVFLQGGPGFEATRPSGTFGWISHATKYFRVLLLDQRGTGNSTPVDGDLISTLGDSQAQAKYLRNFRADSIVRDCEFIRNDLNIEQWSLLGQSFGGFCLLHYLSSFPESLTEGFFTGGVPPIGRSPDDVYRATYRRMIARNAAYFDRYPQDIERVRSVLQQLETNPVHLPSGDLLTAQRYRTLGHALGMSTGAEEVHYLVERGLDYWALRGIENAQKWDTNPIYQVLHESSYADGHFTGWSAHRLRAEFPEFDDLELPYFTGEHVYPWQVTDWKRLNPFKEVAEILADELWPMQYDPARLAKNRVPCAAAVYTYDPYVEREYSEETAKAVPGLQLWVSDEHDHDGLRTDGELILSQLFEMTGRQLPGMTTFEK